VEYRKKGYMRMLLEDSVAYMTDEGYDISMLAGIPRFYDKFGYAVCLPTYALDVQVSDLGGARGDDGSYRVRPISPGDVPALIALYDQSNALRSCSVQRTVEHFPAFHTISCRDRHLDHLVVQAGNGNALGYAVFDPVPGTVNVLEVEAEDDAMFGTILDELVALAAEKACESIRCFLPLDHPFAEYVQRYGCEWRILWPKQGGWMVRIINQRTLFSRIEPELARRVSERTNLCGTLTIQTDLHTTTLEIDHGMLTVTDGAHGGVSVSLSQDRLAQLIAGARSSRDVLNDPGVKTGGEVRALLEVLFPKGHPWFWLWDQF